MAEPEDRSEEPTEYRLAEARRRGGIPSSRDLQSGLTAFAIGLALIFGGRAWLVELLAYMRISMSRACSEADLAGAGQASIRVLVNVLEIPMGVGMAVALVGGAVLTRGLFSSSAFRFDLGRILPSSRRWRGNDTWVETSKMLGKTTIVIALAWGTLRPVMAGLFHLEGSPTGKSLAVASTLAETLGLRLGLAAVAMGVADCFWQRFRHRRSLRMTRDEVQREQKEREGDPRLRSARERLRMESLRQPATAEVRRANLVVVDGEGKAVALRYDPADSRAPVVVCKGERLIATKMVQVARESDVPICSDGELTAVLARVEEDEEIPEASHEAVARLLAARHT